MFTFLLLMRRILSLILAFMASLTLALAQPANDDPCNAIALTVGTSCSFTQYTNAGATATAGPPAPGCASYSGGDVWFTAVVPANGAITIDANSGVITDGGMAVYTASSCSGPFTLVQCDDDNSANGLMPYLNLTGLTGGSTIYIRFWEYGNDNNGTFSICTYNVPPPPPLTNDDPCGAIPVTVGTSCNYTQYTNAGAGASSGIPAPGCASYSGGDVWFTAVVPASGNLTLDGNTGVITDGGMAVYTAASCSGPFTLVQCDDDNSANGLMPMLNLTGLTPGSTIYIRFWEYGNDNNGTFSLCVYDATAPPPPPSNACLSPIPDDCINACNLGTLPAPPACNGSTPLSQGAAATFNLSNVGATAGSPYSAVTGCASPASDVWYRFTASGTQLQLSITSDATDPLNTPNVNLYNGSNCNALLPIACFQGSGGNLSLQTYAPITPNDVYYLQISGANPLDQGLFTLTIKNNYDCDACLLQDDLTVTPPPTNGTYQPGTTVTFCFTVSNYNQTAANWLHGVDLNFGPGWDISTLSPTSIPASCATTSGASWGWYNSVTGSNSGTTYGPGFFYETSSGNASGVVDGNPGNNFGDQGVGTSCPTTFCWRISTLPPGSCVNGASLNVAINTLGDYESGSWSSTGCGNDPVVNFNSTLSCCQPATLTATSTSCGLNNGTATATPGSTYAPYSYTWSNNSGITVGTATGVAGAHTISNMPAGQYFVTVTDASGCTTSGNVIIPSSAAGSATASNTGPYCVGGTISLDVTPAGTGYTWSGPNGFSDVTQNPTINGATTAMAGTYNVTVTYSGGCSASASTTVAVSAGVAPSITPSTTAVCPGQSATLTASGGASYTWSNSATTAAITVSPTSTTTYTVTASSGPSCTATATATVTVNTAPPAAVTPATAAICNGGSTTLTASGGTTYLWSGTETTAAITVSPTTTTTYTVTVTDANTCTATASGTVTINPNPTAAISPSPAAICNGSSSTLTASGGVSYVWSTTETTAAITVTPTTTSSYDVTVTDANGCTGTATQSITVNTNPTVSINPATITVCGGLPATLTASGAATYVWSDGATTAANTVTPAATTVYTVTGSDANGCTGTATATVNVAAGFTLSDVITNVTCNAGADGSIAITPNGGTAPFVYNWSNSNTSPSINGLTAATYTVTVVDNVLCTVTASYAVTEPTAIVFGAPAITDATCNTGGSIQVSASGGTGAINFSWSNGATGSFVNGLAPGAYTITATDGSLCTATASYTVGASANAIIITQQALADVSCNGGSDGAITISTSGGTSAISVTWSTGGTTNTISGLIAGTYSVTATDINGCSSSASYVIAEPTIITFNAPVIQDVLCSTPNSGSITANPTGGNGGYSYSWTQQGSGQTFTGQTISGLGADTYNLTVTDSKGCTATDAYTVNQPAALTFTTAHTDVSCNGGSNGTATVTITNGTPPYAYDWNSTGPQSNNTISGLPAGIVTVTVTDANCNVSASIIVSEPTAVTVSITYQQNVSCNGGSDGELTATANGGTPGYTYSWSNGSSGANLTALAATAYTVTVADVNNCTAVTSATILEPSAISTTISATDALCNQAPNGSAQITVTGGTAPYTYLWSDGQTTPDASGLVAGFYAVTVLDFNNCSATASTNVNEPTDMQLSYVATAVKCIGDQNGTLTIYAQGGTPPYNYSATQDFVNFVSTTDGVILNLAVGDYSVIVSDNNGCTKTIPATVPDATPDAFLSQTDSTSCYGADYNDGGAHIIATSVQNGPYQFSIDGGPQQYSGDFYNLSAGNHTITTYNYFGCVTTVPVLVSEPLPIIVDVNPDTLLLPLGQGGPVVVTYLNATNVHYAWTPTLGLSCIDCPNPTVTVYQPGDYLITVSMQNGTSTCYGTATLHVDIEEQQPVFIPNSFSPNGDGNNDMFMIYGQGIKTVALKIFNRWGELVFESDNQFNGWDGTYKGVLQNPAVYTYTAQITFLNDKKISKNGSITILH